MPPKGGNAKKEGGRAKKAENEANKKAQAVIEKEKKEADEWKDGSRTAKASKEDKEEKRKADLLRKAENARLLAEEEASASAKVKVAPKAAGKTKPTPKPAGPGAIAAGGGLGGGSSAKDAPPEEIESYAATGIDNAIDLLEVVTAKMDKASVGQQAAGIERHPEAAYEAYQERELPKAKIEVQRFVMQTWARGANTSFLSIRGYGYSSTRHVIEPATPRDLLYKQFQKSPENPFNQTIVSYDASKEEKLGALQEKKAQVEARLKEKKQEDDAETAKQRCDPIVIQQSQDGSEVVLRVYRADPNPLTVTDMYGNTIPEANYLRPPPIEKNFLISPPGSPPVGWEQIKEDPPNATPLADDLMQALRRLQLQKRRSSMEVLLDPEEGSGVGVYVEDCGNDGCDDVDESAWVYGEMAPVRTKWAPVATAMPPLRAMVA
ncbi:hypothetical protein DXG01_016631 [Tephrocybe rancida]|nr:hypothetical protein DXG01_016631 [Tephrocybe rancida]